MVAPLVMGGVSAVKEKPALAIIPIAVVGGVGYLGYRFFQKINPFNIAGGAVKSAKKAVSSAVSAVGDGASAVGSSIYDAGKGTKKQAKKLYSFG